MSWDVLDVFCSVIKESRVIYGWLKKNKKKSFNADNCRTKISCLLAKKRPKREMIKDRKKKDQVALPEILLTFFC